MNRRIRLTLPELRALGLDWPPGPVEAPADEAATFDLEGEAAGCEALYHDFKGDPRYSRQGKLFEALAAEVKARVPRDPAEVRREAMREVLARPDDDGPRLAYAQALGEGDPYAQFIHLQCDAARLPWWSARRRALLGRAQALRDAHWASWGRTRDPLVDPREPSDGPVLTFWRGFASGLSLDAATRGHLALLREHPIRELRFTGDPTPLATADVGAVRRLVLNGGPIAGALDLATKRGTWRCVEELVSLTGVVRVEPGHVADAARVVAAITGGEALPLLRSLALPDTPLDAATLAPLTTRERAFTLATLQLRVKDEAAVAALARPLPALERLTVVGDLYEPAARPRIAPLAGLVAERLRELDLRGVVLDLAGGEALAAAPWVPALEAVTLIRTEGGQGALPLLARLGPSLRALTLACDDCAGAGEALARGQAGAGLAFLSVHKTIAARELDALLAAAPALETVAMAFAPPADRDVPARLARRGFVAQGHGTWVRGGG